MIHSYRDTATVIPPTVGILISLYFLHLLFSKMSDKNEWLASDCFFTIQSVLSININSPIRKLLLSIIESFSGYLIDAKYMSNTLFTNFLTAEKANRYMMWNKMGGRNHSRFHWRRQPFRKSCYSWGRTRWYWYRLLWKLKDLPRIVFIDGCRNHKVVIDGGELTSNNNKRKKPDVLQAYGCPL